MDKVSIKLAMKFPAALLRLWRFTDYYATRYQLACVKVDFQRGIAEATNGRIIVREAIEVSEAFISFEPVLLYSPDLKRISRMFREPRDRSELQLVLEDGQWFAKTDSVRVSIATEDGRFPNTDMIYGMKLGKVAKFVLSLQQLRQFTAAFHSLDDVTETYVNVAIPLEDDGGVADLTCRGVHARLRFASHEGRWQDVRIEEYETQEDPLPEQGE